MAKRNQVKIASKNRKSALRIESLEQRQLLATIVGSGSSPDSYQNITAPNGNVYDQVLMTGASVTVTADAGQVTRVSFLDLSGDIVQAEFGGKGTLTISLDQFKAAAPADKYNQPGVSYVSGLATFTIQGEDASTNFGVFSVGTATANGGAVNLLFAGGKTGGNGVADVAKLLIVADPQNPGGFSTMGGIRAGNAVFADSLGVVGISAQNVQVQGPVIIGDIDASNAGVPSLVFGAQSQFATLVVAGGDLLQSNNVSIQTGGALGSVAINTVNSQDGTNASGTTVRSQVIPTNIPNTTTATFANAPAGGVVTLDTTTTFDLTGLTQAQIDTAFKGRTFTSSVTVAGDLASNFTLAAGEFRGDVSFSGAVSGPIAVTNGIKNVSFAKGLGGALTALSIGNITSASGNISGAITSKSIGNVTVSIGTGTSGGNLTGAISTDADASSSYTSGEKAIGNITVDGNVSARITGVLGIGNVTIKGNLTGRQNANGNGGFRTLSDAASTSGDAFTGNIGTIAVSGDVNLKAATDASDASLISMNRGTFGNITVGGAGTLNSADLSVANYLGNISVANQLTATSGTITVTDGASLVLGTITVKNTSTMGAVSLTSGSVAQTTNSTGAIVAGNSITTTASTGSNGSFTLSGLTLAGAEVITLNALQGRALSAISATTIDTTNAVITVGGLINGTSSVGSVTLNAGVNGTVNVNNDIGGTAIVVGNTSDIGTQTNLTTVGAVTISGGQVNFAANSGIFAKAGLTSLTVTAAGTGAAAISFAVPATSPNIEIGGTSGAITLNGNVTMASAATIPTILASNGLSSLDSIASVTINGRVIGGGVAAGKSDIRASSIGDITVKGALSQTQALVKGLSIIATNNGSPATVANTSAGGAVAAVASNAETISRDGANLSGYALGNITVQSTNTIGVTSTRLFDTANSFYAAGKIGNITLAGGGSAAVPSSVFGATPAAGVGATFSVGDGDGLANANAGLDLDGNGVIGNGGTATTTFNSSITGAIETAGSFTTVSTATIGNISINSAGATDNVLGTGGNAGASSLGLRILAGVKAPATTDFTSNTIVRNDASLNGTVGTITVTNLNQQLSVNGAQTAGFNQFAKPAGVIAAAGSATSTAANFGAINGVAIVAGTDFAAAGNNKVVGGTADTSLDPGEIIVIRV